MMAGSIQNQDLITNLCPPRQIGVTMNRNRLKRFGLRTLFIVIALSCGFAAFLTNVSNGYYQEKKLLESLEVEPLEIVARTEGQIVKQSWMVRGFL